VSYLEVDPYIPVALWVMLAVAAAALVSAYAWTSRKRLTPLRWRGVVALMGLAVVLPLAILLNPTWLRRIPPPAGKPVLTVLLDASASMATKDIPSVAGRTRYEAGRDLAAEISRGLGERFDVEFRTFSSSSRPVSLDDLSTAAPDGAATDLAVVLDEAVATDRPQGQALLLVSDGVHNTGTTNAVRESVARAKAANVPVYARTIGGISAVRDIDVMLPSPQELAFVGQSIPLRAKVRQRGNLVRGTIRAALKRDNQVVRQTEFELVPDGAVDVEFQVEQPKVGLFRYEVAVPAHFDEVTDVNNSAAMLVRVVDEPVQVLLLEGKPYWDTKFLIRTLSADPSITLTTMVRMAPGRLLARKIAPADVAAKPQAPAKSDGAAKKDDKTKTDAPAATIARQESWAIQTDAGRLLADPATLTKHQIIIFGRDAEAFLSDEAVAQLRRWLNAGDGSVVCFRGAPSAEVNERLATLLPVRWTPSDESRFRVRLTPSGQDLHWLSIGRGGDDDPLAKLPSLARRARPQLRPALTTVLATAVGARQPTQADPVVSYQPVGLGRVVVIEGAGMWRWAFLPHAYEQLDNVYGTLWRSLTRWLVASAGLLPSQKVALRTDQVTFNTDDVVSATMLLRESLWKGEPPKVELVREGAPPGLTRRLASIAPVATGDAPGHFVVPLGRLPEGRYQARVVGVDDAAARTAFDVRGNLRERLDVAVQADLMRFIAEETGGSVLEETPTDELARKFEQHLAQSRPERTLRSPAWDRWWVLAGLVVVWGAAWGLRRWSGLV
jgi:hypothetical protein